MGISGQCGLVDTTGKRPAKSHIRSLESENTFAHGIIICHSAKTFSQIQRGV